MTGANDLQLPQGISESAAFFELEGVRARLLRGKLFRGDRPHKTFLSSSCAGLQKLPVAADAQQAGPSNLLKAESGLGLKLGFRTLVNIFWWLQSMC